MYIESTPALETFKIPDKGEAFRIPLSGGRSLLIGRLGTPDGSGAFVDLVTANGDEYELAYIEDKDDALSVEIWKDLFMDEETSKTVIKHSAMKEDESRED